MNNDLYFVFDVESIGLHGEGFAVGWVVVDWAGNVNEAGTWACPPELAKGTVADHRWVADHCKFDSFNRENPRHVRDSFWSTWLRWKGCGAVMVADCPWPVEARFLIHCIEDNPSRQESGPYPLLDVASVRRARGLDPLATLPRLPGELPEHNPLNDARQSARVLLEALNQSSKV